MKPVLAAIGFVAVLVVFGGQFLPLGTDCHTSGRSMQMSDLRQIVTANLIYAADANDYLPADVLRTQGGNVAMAERYKAAIDPYLKSQALWVSRYEQNRIEESPRIGMDGHVSSFCTVGDFWFDHKLSGESTIRAKTPNPEIDTKIPFLRDNIYADPADRKRELNERSDRLFIAFIDGRVKAVPQAEFIAKAKVL